jgi:uncharacterized RDD family membrane protein YckC
MSDLGNERPAAPEPLALPGAAALPPASPVPSGAGFSIRLLARLIDLFYGAILGFMVGVMTGILFSVLSHLGRLTPEWPRLVSRFSFTGFGLGILGAFLYHSLAEGIGTATIGKLICGLRVVQVDGRPATLGGAFVRDLAYHIDALFFGLVGYASMAKGPLQQRFGDVWGHTVVVKTAVFEPNPQRGPLRMALGILAGSLLWASMTFLQLVLKVT